jgi:hypothetical protein
MTVMYVKFNSTPSWLNWDYQDPYIQASVFIAIPTPSIGTWYIGVWGFKQCEYLLSAVTVTSQCVSQCSNHGTCNGNSCSCNNGYTGSYCENKTAPLQNNEQVSGYVEENVWNYYTYQANVQENIVITVTQLNDGDCDLYIRFNNTPSRWLFDYIDISATPTYTLTIPNVLGQVVNIGVFGWKKTSYNIKVETTRSCVPDCVHGTCTAGVCLCQDSWSGPVCDQQYQVLSSTVPVEGNITADEWHYYKFTTTETTVVISLRETWENPTTNVGLLNLLVAEAVTPSLRQYDYADFSQNRGFHTVTMSLDARKGETITWVIGVFGSGFVVNRSTYKLVAWEAK